MKPLWATLGRLTNPAADVILADSGSLGSAKQEIRVTIVVYATVATSLQLQLRNSTNSANLNTQELPLPLNTLVTMTFPLTIEGYQRLRIVTTVAIVGDTQASIFIE